MVGLGRNGGNGHEEDGSFSIRFGDIKKTFAWGPGHGDCPKGSNAWLKGCTALIETKSHSPAQFVTVCFSAREGMDQFVNNLESLVLHAPEFTGPNPAARDEFNRKAAAWRAAAVKPILPENARQHKVLAENAIQEKDFEQAIDEYEAALDAFPTWPEGQFNVALLCGEMGDYEEAIEHMQNYLMLVPEAQDAPAARDKMLVWEHKITAR
jgi:tetratricopeptide (TPR) repeat protein